MMDCFVYYVYKNALKPIFTKKLNIILLIYSYKNCKQVHYLFFSQFPMVLLKKYSVNENKLFFP